MRTPVRHGAAALVLAALLLVGGCGDDDGSAAAGDLVQGRLGDVDGTRHSLQLPNGELTVVVGDGQSSLAATDAADGQERDAPDGTEWVALDWRLDPGAGVDPLQHSLMEDDSRRTSLVLRSGGSTVDLGDAPGSTATPGDTRTSGTVHVALDPDAAAVVDVTFDGVTTSLDARTGEVTGDQADALADLADPVADDCPPLRGDGVTADIACTYVVTTVPYLAGQGWSDDGWTVAQVDTRADTFTRGPATYDVQGTEDLSGFDGAAGQSAVVDERLDSLVARVVTEGGADRLEIVRRLTGVRTDGKGPDDATAELSATVDLG